MIVCDGDWLTDFGEEVQGWLCCEGDGHCWECYCGPRSQASLQRGDDGGDKDQHEQVSRMLADECVGRHRDRRGYCGHPAQQQAREGDGALGHLVLPPCLALRHPCVRDSAIGDLWLN